jgi:Flp pilus assembly protein TadG
MTRWPSSIIRRFGRQLGLPRLARDRRGAAAAEFAVVAPAVALLLFGTVQYGLLWYSYTAMINSARNGARLVAFRLSTVPQVETAVRGMLPGWLASDATVTVQENDAGNARVTISVPGTKASLIGLAPVPATVSASITMPRVDL